MTKTDVQVRHDVMAELEWEPVVQDATAIGVGVDHGAVTLSGEVGTYFEKTQALAATKRVAGVRAIADDLTVRSAADLALSDSRLAQAVQNALEANTAVPANLVRPVVANAWVTLEGEVHWQYQREAAVRSLMHIRGIRGVSNHITIREAPASPLEVKAKIESACERQADIDAARVRVTVEEGGTVVLQGDVPAAYERDAAVRAAWCAKGVRHVDDQLRVHPLR